MTKKYKYRDDLFFELEMNGTVCMSYEITGSVTSLQELCMLIRCRTFMLGHIPIRSNVTAYMTPTTAWFCGTTEMDTLSTHGMFHYAEFPASRCRLNCSTYSLDDVMMRLVELGLLNDTLHTETEPDNYEIIL
jgi:hypothetical protein